MNKYLIIAVSFCAILAFSCGNTSGDNGAVAGEVEAVPAALEDSAPKHVIVSERTVYYESTLTPSTAFIVISKKYTDLSVYAPVGNDTVLVARYPVCLSRLKGQKEKAGDMRTPECTMEKPFTITQIQNASDWHHDFGDGRGSIKAYGNWFLRLSTPPHTGIGIHGSTNNESTVPGRDSEGCIRMRDADIIHLKENYAYKGMKVIVKHEDQDMLPFEIRINSRITSSASAKPDSDRMR